MANIRAYNMNGTLILGIDHGYGNIKTAHRVFPTALIKSGKAMWKSRTEHFYDKATENTVNGIKWTQRKAGLQPIFKLKSRD